VDLLLFYYDLFLKSSQPKIFVCNGPAPGGGSLSPARRERGKEARAVLFKQLLRIHQGYRDGDRAASLSLY
jgi:hypothetical protein